MRADLEVLQKLLEFSVQDLAGINVAVQQLQMLIGQPVPKLRLHAEQHHVDGMRPLCMIKSIL